MSYQQSDVKLTVKSRHNPHAALLSAFDNEDTLTFTLTVRRSLGAASPCLELVEDAFTTGDDGNPVGKDTRTRFYFDWKDTDYQNERYTLTFPLAGRMGLHFATVLFDSAEGPLRLSYDPMSYTPCLKRADEHYESIALTVYDSAFTTPAWFKGGILYQIFVDRFAKGGDVPLRQDAILNEDWENGIPQYAPYRGAPLKNNMFFGGTLWGVADKLDYLASLGVTALYLSPIFKAYSNHKYDTGDYMAIDEMFGGEEAFDHLIAEAKKRSIAVILDGVFNHTGDDSRYFNKYGKYDTVGAYQSKESPYYDWFSFEDYPDRYRAWWGIDILPAVNTKNPAYREFICGEEGVIRRYLRKGIAGWRLDVADELSEILVKEIRSACRKEKADALLLGEVWEDAAVKIAYDRRRSYFHGAELDAVMNYPLGNAIIDYVKSGDAAPLFATAKRLYAHYPKAVSDVNMNLLGTHDTERILTRLSGVEENGRTADELAVARLTPDKRALAKKRLKTAWFLLSVMPGVPCIFYGDEVGMEGYHDPFNRRPFPWGQKDEELLAFYRHINAIRRSQPLLAEGYLSLTENLPRGLFMLERFDGHDKLIAAVNLSDSDQTLSLDGYELLRGEAVKKPFLLKKNSYCLVKSKK